MNFKLNKIKVIGSILVSSILSYPLHSIIFPCKPITTDISGLIADPICAFSPTYSLYTFWLIVILLILIIYLIWSLVDIKC